MSDEELRRMQMRICFDSTDPDLTRLPHFICAHSDSVIDAVEAAVQTPLAVWGQSLFVDADGKTYFRPNGPKVEDFKLWALPGNQSHIKQWLFTSGFSMVIPANTSPSTLRKLYDLANPEDQGYDYYLYIAHVAPIIPEIGWAYIPLEREHDYALFVASRENRHLVDQLRKQLEQIGISPIFNISVTDSGQRWNGPILWESE